MQVRTFDQLVRLKFTLFGLPFVTAGALLPLALGEAVVSWNWLWILTGFFGGALCRDGPQRSA